MRFRTPVAITAMAGIAALAAVPVAARAQSVERSIGRWAESIAAAAERLAAQVERRANDLANRIEREFEDKQRRERRQRDRIRREERDDRELQSQAMRIDTTFAFSATGIVDLSSMAGDIVVTGWDRREAQVKASTTRGSLEYEFSSSRLTIEQRTERGNSWRSSRSSEMRYEISVPRGARLMLRSSSGDVTVRGTGGEVEATSQSGDITIEDVSERVEVGTISGDVMLRNVKGNVEANSVSGSVDASEIEGDIHLSSTSGDLTVSNARGRSVELSTSSGEVSYGGAVDPNGRYEFHSHSGTIDLAIPASANARFSVETFSGEIDSDFPITLQPGDRVSGRPRRFEFTIGSGGPRIIAESFSGNVEIRKR
ncbi:MAG: DUF4097 family beta strand repeat-containing protein [Gemmatimonadaceae bacterium]